MKIMLKISVEKVKYKWEEYFIATSDDLQGFMAEWKSFEEMQDNSEKVVKWLLHVKKQRYDDMKKKIFELAYIVYSKVKIKSL